MENNNQIEESKPDGLELLENVIRSNEENIKSNNDRIEIYSKLTVAFEDHLNMMVETQLDLNAVGETYKEAMKFHEEESIKRTEFLENVPTKIEAFLAPEAVENLEKIDSKTLLSDKEKICYKNHLKVLILMDFLMKLKK